MRERALAQVPPFERGIPVAEWLEGERRRLSEEMDARGRLETKTDRENAPINTHACDRKYADARFTKIADAAQAVEWYRWYLGQFNCAA